MLRDRGPSPAQTKRKRKLIDPKNITKYNLSDDELEERILWWVLAAGKNGRTAAKCLDKLLKVIKATKTPFMDIIICDFYEKSLIEIMKACGIGCYTSKYRTLMELVWSNLNLRACIAEDLEKIHGIGMKTSRCFIIHSRKDARYAGLDTHMLKNLKALGIPNVPKSTPSSKKEYLRLEQEVLKQADKASMTAADYDLMVWNKYSVGK